MTFLFFPDGFEMISTHLEGRRKRPRRRGAALVADPPEGVHKIISSFRWSSVHINIFPSAQVVSFSTLVHVCKCLMVYVLHLINKERKMSKIRLSRYLSFGYLRARPVSLYKY